MNGARIVASINIASIYGWMHGCMHFHMLKNVPRSQGASNLLWAFAVLGKKPPAHLADVLCAR